MAFEGVGPRIDLILDPKSDNTFDHVFEDEAGQSQDFTGSTFKLQVKARTVNDDPTGSVVLTLATGSGISGTPANGEVFLTFPDAADSGLSAGEYIYTCIRLVSGVAVESLFWGHIHVNVGIASV